MNVQRFLAATSREALAKARLAFGDATLILSNRQTANGVEVVATTEDMLETFTSGKLTQGRAEPQMAAPAQLPPPRKTESVRARAAAQMPLESAPEQDAEQLAMSTLSFQDYVRERMLKRRHEALHGSADASAPQLDGLTLGGAREERPRATRPSQPASAPTAPIAQAAPRASAARQQAASAGFERAPAASAPSAAVNTAGIVNELQSMRDLIEERFNTLSWLGQARQDPIHSNLMLKLIRSGYSSAVTRAIVERMAPELSAGDAMRWVMEVLERNLKTDAASKPIYQLGGVYAMVGATGVGKTTTTAKLAALCARAHGPQSVGLITLDTYRIAAHEQLRAYGRMLGVVAHLAHDRAALQDLLGLLGNKKMVLIDTTGLAPKDPRTPEMLELLNLPNVHNLLVLNAGSHGDTLDDVLGAFKGQGGGGVILSKVDEAAKLGPALDALIRHQMVLRGVTQGQRVPEDFDVADAASLVRQSMRTSGKSAFDPSAADLGFYFSQPQTSVSLQGALHA